MAKDALSVIFCFVGGIKIKGSQPPYLPPPPHNHRWDKKLDPPIPKPGVSIKPQYVRRGDIVSLQIHVSAPDRDVCQNFSPPPCSFSQNTAINEWKIVNWILVEGRGTFGRIDQNGRFVPESDPTKYTHFKPADDFIGHVSIKVETDDIPYVTDPATGQRISTCNDDPVTSDPVRFTVWEFEINPPYINALPEDGATYNFTATISPSIDHNGNSMAAMIEFRLTSSNEPGYCLNATRTPDDAYDLQIVSGKPDMEISPLWARTRKPTLSASVQVRCFDYGAYGGITAHALGLPETKVPQTPARWTGTFIQNPAQIPLDQRNGLDDDGDGKIDEDLLDGRDNDGDGRPPDEEAIGNYIYDGWQWNNGAATDDNDPQPENQLPPANQPRPGDGLSRYEEYRGFIIQGSHQRLNPNVKDVFIYNPHGLDIGGFATLGLQIHLIRRNEFDAVFDRPSDYDGDMRVDEDPLDGRDNDGDRWYDEDPADADYPIGEHSSFAINRFWKTANLIIQRVIPVLYHPAYDPLRPAPLGTHGAGLPGWYPFALVYIRQMRHYTLPNSTDRFVDPRDPMVIRLIIGNELGNSVNILDHSGATTRQCFMYDTGNSWQNANHDPIPSEYCANRGDIPQGCRLLFYLR